MASPKPGFPVLLASPGHLIRVAQQVHATLWRSVLGTEVTSVQYGCLLVIANEPALDQQTLGVRMSLDKVTVTDVTRRMVKAALIERVRSTEDRRRSLLELTPEGRRRHHRWTPLVLEVQRLLLAPLTARQRTTLVRDLRTIAGPFDDTTDVALDVQSSLYTTAGHLIRRAQQRHSSLWQQHVGQEVTSVQYALLLELLERPPTSQAGIGSVISVDKSTGADVVSRLNHRGLLERTQDARDGRQNLVTITRRGRELVDTLAPGVLDVQTLLLAPLAESARGTFMKLLSSVAFRDDGCGRR